MRRNLRSRWRGGSWLPACLALLLSACAVSPSAPPKPTIVLVHGAFGDAQVWKPVQAALEQEGFKTIAVDLPGRPGNPLPAQQATLAGYRDAVLKAMAGEKAPVVLVGHSFGGMTISMVAEAEPARVRKLVYVAAYLPANGDSLQSLAATDADSKIGPNIIVDAPNGVVRVAFAARADLFCNDCSAQARAMFPSTLVDEPLPPPGMPAALTAARFGKVPKAYVRTTRDNVVSPALQGRMAGTAGVTQVVVLDSGHAPFVSQPQALALAIASVAMK